MVATEPPVYEAAVPEPPGTTGEALTAPTVPTLRSVIVGAFCV
jgi:hypothetical protein